MPDPYKIPIRASTQDHLEIEDILDDVVLLKDGSATVILSVTALNFGLLSEKEQDAMIYAYAALLNSLTFAIQLIIRSRRTDISSYLKLIDQAAAGRNSPEIQAQIQKYRSFIQSLVKENNVLDKKFYVAIPFSSLELGISKSAIGTLSGRRSLPYPKDYIIERAKMNLYPKRDHLIRQFARIGLKVKQLTTQELIQLFFNWYNPDNPSLHLTASDSYTSAMVEPAFSGPASSNRPQPNPLEESPNLEPAGTTNEAQNQT